MRTTEPKYCAMCRALWTFFFLFRVVSNEAGASRRLVNSAQPNRIFFCTVHKSVFANRLRSVRRAWLGTNLIYRRMLAIVVEASRVQCMAKTCSKSTFRIVVSVSVLSAVFRVLFVLASCTCGLRYRQTASGQLGKRCPRVSSRRKDFRRRNAEYIFSSACVQTAYKRWCLHFPCPNRLLIA